MGDMVLTHNHPRGTAFSYADLQLAFIANLSEIRAIGTVADGRSFLYVLRRPEGGWPLEKLREIIATYKALWTRSRAELISDIEAGRTTLEKVQAEHNNQVMLKLAELYPEVINYERIEI